MYIDLTRKTALMLVAVVVQSSFDAVEEVAGAMHGIVPAIVLTVSRRCETAGFKHPFKRPFARPSSCSFNGPLRFCRPSQLFWGWGSL